MKIFIDKWIATSTIGILYIRVERINIISTLQRNEGWFSSFLLICGNKLNNRTESTRRARLARQQFHELSVASTIRLIAFTMHVVVGLSKGRNGFHPPFDFRSHKADLVLLLSLSLSTVIIRGDIEKKRREKKYSYNRAKSSNPPFKGDFVEKLKAPNPSVSADSSTEWNSSELLFDPPLWYKQP